MRLRIRKLRVLHQLRVPLLVPRTRILGNHKYRVCSCSFSLTHLSTALPIDAEHVRGCHHGQLRLCAHVLLMTAPQIGSYSTCRSFTHLCNACNSRADLTRDASILGPHQLDEFVRAWAEYDPCATYAHSVIWSCSRSCRSPVPSREVESAHSSDRFDGSSVACVQRPHPLHGHVRYAAQPRAARRLRQEVSLPARLPGAPAPPGPGSARACAGAAEAC